MFIRFSIARGDNLGLLNLEINEMAEAGWEKVGRLRMSRHGYWYHFMQQSREV